MIALGFVIEFRNELTGAAFTAVVTSRIIEYIFELTYHATKFHVFNYLLYKKVNTALLTQLLTQL